MQPDNKKRHTMQECRKAPQMQKSCTISMATFKLGEQLRPFFSSLLM